MGRLHELGSVIAAGDIVVLNLGHNQFQQLKVSAGDTLQTRYGALLHNDAIGKEFGHKLKLPRGFVVLQPVTPELWTVTLRHRTQVLFFHDISLIIFNLELKPGSIVVESGTGSGSLSHSILRTIAPAGHLHTFEFNEARHAEAAREFEENGYSDMVTTYHRDVLQDGFGLSDTADAVFLDLPSPWTAVPHARSALKSGGRICNFSPCIEQTQRVCENLQQLGFADISTIEVVWQKLTMKRRSAVTPQFSRQRHVETPDPERPQVSPSGDSPPGDCKRARMDEADINQMEVTVDIVAPHPQRHQTQPKQVQVDELSVFPYSPLPAHTGYLTFATLYEKTTI